MMYEIIPNYYDEFQCIAAQCNHNCCIGWEIDIDEETFQRYQAVGGSFGKRLCQSISLDETPHFHFADGERCPFLNEHNLCDIILQLGENSLCQICSDHPRFRNFFDSYTEIGLGLCCEAAGRLILGQKEKFSLLQKDKIVLTSEEKSFFHFRQTLLTRLQDRKISMNIRVDTILRDYGIAFSEKTCSQWAAFYLELEYMEEAWRASLQGLLKTEVFPKLKGKEWEIPSEQLLIYFLYRHLSGALEDGRLSERLAFSVLSYRMILALCGQQQAQTGSFVFEDFVEIARMYSSEIEYSEENTEALFAQLGIEESLLYD